MPNTKSAQTRPTRWTANALYIGISLVNIVYVVAGICIFEAPALRTLIFISFMGLMWGIDEFEEKRFGLHPPLNIGIALLTLRLGLLVIIAFSDIDCSGFHRFLYLLIPIFAYLYFGRRIAYTFGAISYTTFFASFFILKCGCTAAFLKSESFISDTFIMLVGMIFALMTAQVIRHEEENRNKAEKLLVELEQSQKQVAELATASERNRIARDIHDSLGHHLTSINIQLEKAQTFQDIDLNESKKALENAKRSASEALQDVRKSVASLREDQDFNLKDALDGLVTSFPDVPIKLELEGDETKFSQPTLITLFRIAQEGLTNIRKHANATNVALNIQLGNEAKLTLQDDGNGFQLNEKRTGNHFGLQGLKERLELLGGQLNISTELGKGTILAASIPKQGLGA